MKFKGHCTAIDIYIAISYDGSWSMRYTRGGHVEEVWPLSTWHTRVLRYLATVDIPRTHVCIVEKKVIVSSSFSFLDVRKDSRQSVKDGCQYKRGDRWAEKENSPTWYVRNSNHLFTAGLSGVLKHLLSHKPHFAISHFPQSHVGLCVNLDGDKKAYSESSQWAIKGNKEVISKLRQENKQLRAKLSKRMKVSVHVVQKISKHNIA